MSIKVIKSINNLSLYVSTQAYISSLLLFISHFHFFPLLFIIIFVTATLEAMFFKKIIF